VIRTFKSQSLADLWNTGKSKIDKLHGRILVRLDRLNVANRPDDMNLPGFKFDALKGFDPTRHTVHVNGPWCITFEFEDGDAVRVDFRARPLRSRPYGRACRDPGPEPLPCPSRRAVARGDPRHWEVEGRDRQASPYLPPASLDILHEKKPVSAAVAVRLGKLFGDGAGVWIGMQGATTNGALNAKST
jgi:proteic killer suppression protein